MFLCCLLFSKFCSCVLVLSPFSRTDYCSSIVNGFARHEVNTRLLTEDKGGRKSAEGVEREGTPRSSLLSIRGDVGLDRELREEKGVYILENGWSNCT